MGEKTVDVLASHNPDEIPPTFVVDDDSDVDQDEMVEVCTIIETQRKDSVELRVRRVQYKDKASDEKRTQVRGDERRIMQRPRTGRQIHTEEGLAQTQSHLCATNEQEQHQP